MANKTWIYTLLIIVICSCTKKKTELVWNESFPQIGSQSSPRAADLNGDGVLDLVMGAGKNEYENSDYGVIAINGVDGKIIWKQASKDQIYGSATFVDINKDGTEDIVIGGRSNQLMALNGKNGSKIWEYEFKYEADSILQYARFNFQNSVKILDQNGDGIQEILVINGGNAKAAAGTMENRFPGVIMIMNPVNGEILAADKTPDLLESYTPPLYFEQANGEEYVVFGTGGETISGSLYIALLSDIKARNLKNARKIHQETGHGYIAPPVAVDLNNDGFFEIVAASHASTMVAIDGKSYETLWERKIPYTETSNALSVGNFDKDGIPDFFTFVSKGIWPDSKGSVQVVISGANGEVTYTNSLGCTGFSSPVIYDLNGDGIDEAILSINEYDCNKGFTGESDTEILNKLIAIDFVKNKIQPIDETPRFKNIFTSPWIGDLDGDKYLDIVYFQYFHADTNILLFFGMQGKRISSSMKYRKPVKWGAYMNSEGNGIYR